MMEQQATKAIDDLAMLTMFSRYSRPTPSTSLENYTEIMNRVFDMHRNFIDADRLASDPRITEMINDAYKSAVLRKVFPSGRSLQFGGKDLLKHMARNYNCTASFAVAPHILYKSLYLLLCGSGVGMSIQKHHVAQLPPITFRDAAPLIYTIDDSIEGWALAMRVLLVSFFEMNPDSNQPDENKMIDDADYFRHQIVFDYTKIRPKGSKISNMHGKAPGPDPLRKALDNIAIVFEARVAAGEQDNKLRPIDVFDILAFASDAVLAGGIRRSAMLMLFSYDDQEMMAAKVGNWFVNNPQRARANISALILRDDFTEEVATVVLQNAQQFGEPGFILSDSLEVVLNPCAEIQLFCVDLHTQKVGFQFCNLSEINMSKVGSKSDFLGACRNAAIIGTLQAMYTDFSFLGATTEMINRESALLGVSMTGIMQNIKFGLDPVILQCGAAVVKETNDLFATMIGISKAHRLTTTKPSGTASVVLSIAACGIHPAHAERYIRRVQVSDTDPIAAHYAAVRPLSKQTSVWSESTEVVSFPIDISNVTDLKTKENTSAIELLEAAKCVQTNWVMEGHVVERQPEGFKGNNNVSLTVNVKTQEEWQEIAVYLVQNKAYFTGVSFLSASGDIDYQQAPFECIWSAHRLLETFGNGVLFTSRLIVDVKRAFAGSLHEACSAVQFNTFDGEEVKDELPHHKRESVELKKNSVRCIRKFARDYFDADETRAIECLKRVDGLYTYERLVKEAKKHPVDWTTLKIADVDAHEDRQAESRREITCSGNACTLTRL